MTKFPNLHRRKTLDEERTKRRIHKIVPWIKNPLQGVDKEHLVFAPRHEANTLELFFDLFFVANLATFTAYHAVSNHSTLFSYVGFFVIIWTTWYHVTLHDVRFAHDTIYERVCKTIQMITFVGFSLVGSAFDPGTEDGNNTNFRVLCYTLVLVHVLLIIQYSVVFGFVVRSKFKKALIPLGLNIAVYVVAAIVFVAMTPAFKEGKALDADSPIFSVWWLVLVIETMATVGISCFWRMLSFKKTHLVERMGLLTLIVIGEGAIGATKTISKMMGKYGLDPQGSVLVLCIILILMAIWMIYFDHHPHGHYGTIRQQLWATLHFPLHLAIVGVVEGAQQVALARYVLYNLRKLGSKLVDYCLVEQYDGQDLVDGLNSAIAYFQLDKKLEGKYWQQNITDILTEIGNERGICSGIDGVELVDLPDQLQQVFVQAASGIYASLGVKLDVGDDPFTTALHSWKIVYRYFWSATLMLLACFILCMVLIRRNRIDFFDIMTLANRGIVFVVAAVLLGLSANTDAIYSILETPFILPLVVVLLYALVLSDRFAAWFANKRNKRSGEPLTYDADDSYGEHSDNDGHDGQHHNSHAPETQSFVNKTPKLSPKRISAAKSSGPSTPYNLMGAAMMPGYPESFQYGPAASTTDSRPPMPPPMPSPHPGTQVPTPNAPYGTYGPYDEQFYGSTYGQPNVSKPYTGSI